MAGVSIMDGRELRMFASTVVMALVAFVALAAMGCKLPPAPRDTGALAARDAAPPAPGR
jgi:hypothetical protein